MELKTNISVNVNSTASQATQNIACIVNDKKEQKKFKNSFGELSSDAITLFVFGKRQEIKFQDIIKIRFVKTQVLHLNYLAFTIAILLLYFIKKTAVSDGQHVFIIVVSMVLLLLSFYFKSFKYKFILTKKNDFIQIDVPLELHAEAKNLANQYRLLERLSN